MICIYTLTERNEVNYSDVAILNIKYRKVHAFQSVFFSLPPLMVVNDFRVMEDCRAQTFFFIHFNFRQNTIRVLYFHISHRALSRVRQSYVFIYIYHTISRMYVL